jgi:hypothetical protein
MPSPPDAVDEAPGACEGPGMTRPTAVPACLLALLLALSCAPRGDTESSNASHEASQESLIVPGTRVGPVDSASSEAALIGRAGGDQVARRDAYLGEGFCAPGSVVFPGTPDSLIVTWTDSTLTQPASASVTGQGSRWHTAAGVRVGSLLAELEKLGGGPITFMGFDWDYGGRSRWTEPGGGEVAIVLAPDREAMSAISSDPRFGEILGDREVSSDHPLIRGMEVRVVRIDVIWAPATVQYECFD